MGVRGWGDVTRSLMRASYITMYPSGIKSGILNSTGSLAQNNPLASIKINLEYRGQHSFKRKTCSDSSQKRAAN